MYNKSDINDDCFKNDASLITMPPREIMKFVVCSIVVLSYWLYFPICREYREHSEAAALKAFPKCETLPCKTFEETLKV